VFRYWVNDVTPPTLRVRTDHLRSGSPVLVAASDAGAGSIESVQAASTEASSVRFHRHRVGHTRKLTPGTHRLRVRVSDQEAKNTENVGPILPNTRWLGELGLAEPDCRA
jgi:hypothetical protein